MLKSCLKIAWRNIIRHKTSTIVNISGLALGICACIAIYIITSHELSFDTFHPDKDRVYRVMGDVTESTGDKLHFARVSPAVADESRSKLPGLDVIAAIIPYNAPVTIVDENNPQKRFESRLPDSHYITTTIAEPEYFDIFPSDWLAGNADALHVPFNVILTETRAYQYFGTESLNKIIGKQIVYEDSLKVTVAGIIKDRSENTDLLFTDFISFSTLQNSFLKNKISIDSWRQGDMKAWVFTKLAKGTASIQVNNQINQLAKTHADDQIKLSLWLEPLSAMHFNDDIIENPIRTAHLPTLYGLMAIAVFILLLAVINFINLSTAQSIQRAKETGIRKVLGSSRSALILQFLSETFLLTFIAMLLAVSLVNPVLNLFRSYIPAGIIFHLLNASTIIFSLLVSIITAVLAGLYPAWIVSSNTPALSMKGTAIQFGKNKWRFARLKTGLRKGLIIFQFTVSLIFIIGSIVIAWQLKYTREKDPGFNPAAIITLETPRGEDMSKMVILSQRIRQIHGISHTALQWLSPMSDNPRGMKLKLKNTDEKDFWVTQVAGNEDFIPLYDIKILTGRNLTKSDSVNEFVINESLSKIMGLQNPEQAIGKTLYWNDKPYPVAGVVADFHTSSFHDPVTPLCIINRPDRESSLAVKMDATVKQSGRVSAALSQIETAWKQIYPAAAFNYRFYDESLALLYKKDQQTAWLINMATAIAIFISCIGLFGLILFSTQKRAKEISIRKILGASIYRITAMLSREFVLLVVIALLIASPVAWYIMNQWLQDFAYRIHISWWMFALAGITMLSIALITVGFRAIKAAIVSPVKALRSE